MQELFGMTLVTYVTILSYKRLEKCAVGTPRRTLPLDFWSISQQGWAL